MKKENCKWMNVKIQMYFNMFLNEALVYSIGRYMELQC